MLIDCLAPGAAPPDFPCLLADVGGTHARFALQASEHARPQHLRTLRCEQHASLAEAVQAYLRDVQLPLPASAAIAIANPIRGDLVQMTNHHWSFSVEMLRGELGLQRLVVLNDFTALAMALPTLGVDDRRQVGGGLARAGGPMVVLGPGTGLGVSGLVPDGHGDYTPLSGEGGHVTLAPGNAREAAVLVQLERRFGHASAERALSGPGIENLYRALCELDGLPMHRLCAADISARAQQGQDRSCVEAVAIFCSLLGALAGNFALTLGAFGGVFIGGGIVPRWGSLLDHSAFRDRFEAKGRFRDYLADIPTYVICAPTSPSLQGAALALQR